MNGNRAEIARMLAERDPESRRVGAQQLSRVRGGDACELLLQALGDADWRVRKEASLIAPSVTPRDEVIGALLKALTERADIGLRNAAVEALVAIGADAVTPAVGSFATFDADARKLLVEVLGGVIDPRCVKALIRVLPDPDPNVRAAAAEALGRAAQAGDQARDQAVQALAGRLTADDAFLKMAVLDALSKLGADLPWSLVGPLAKDPFLKRYAIAAAARSPEPLALVSLVEATVDASRVVAREAVTALGTRVVEDPEQPALFADSIKAFGRNPRACDAVRAMTLEEHETPLRAAAIATLGLVHDQADVPTIVLALGDADLAEHAEAALRLFGEEGLQPLVEAGRTLSPEIRGAAISLVPVLAAEESGALSLVREALLDPSTEVLAAAVRVFASTGAASDLKNVARFALHADPRVANAAETAIAALAKRHVSAARKVLGDTDAMEADAVIGCLIIGALATHRETAAGDFDFLKAALTNPSARVRTAAVEALAAMEDERAGSVTAFALADEQPQVVLAAVRTLGRLGSADALEALLTATHEPTQVAAALRALAEADPARAVQAAARFVRSLDVAVASAAVEALLALPPTSGSGAAGSGIVGAVDPREEALLGALDHPDPDVVVLALQGLPRPIDLRALPRVGVLLEHPAPAVRKLSADLLGERGMAAAREILRARSAVEHDPEVALAITRALTLLGE